MTHVPQNENSGKNDAASRAPAVARALDLVEFLSDNPRPYGINELARELNVPVNSAFRILKCLEARGYVEWSGDGGYQLGTRLFTLGMRLYRRFDLRLRARKHLETLCQTTGETCQLHVSNRQQVLVLDVITPPTPYFMQMTPGSTLHYHCNAFGKAMLAFMTNEQRAEILDGPLEKMTDSTITNRAVLERELQKVQETGLAYDREEYVKGIYCIGAPVFDASGQVVAGAGLTGLVSRFEASLIAELECQVSQCARNISMDIGWQVAGASRP